MFEGNKSVNAHTYAIWNITNRAYYKRTKYQSCNLLQKVEATVPLDDKATHFYFEPKDNYFRILCISRGDSIL